LGAPRAPVTYEIRSQKEGFILIVAVITFNYKFLVQLETIQSTISVPKVSVLEKVDCISYCLSVVSGLPGAFTILSCPKGRRIITGSYPRKG